ncbi:SusC/RagA family TonB-linked outer membrane protein [Sphingobacterium hungaricum]
MNKKLFERWRMYTSDMPFRQCIKTMKLTCFIFFLTLNLVYAESRAQRISLSMKNAEFSRFINEVTAQTHLKFFYNDELVEKAKPVNIEIKNGQLDDVLKKVFAERNIDYRIVSNTISLTEKSPTNSIKSVEIQNNVSGVVRGEDGSPLVGATVNVKGLNTTTTTNDRGQFSLAANNDATLVIRYVGFISQEVSVNGRSNINVVLKVNDQEIEAVDVVATGYQNIDRKLFTGATSRVDAKDAERNGVPDISRMLEGQVAGVSVQNVSGTFGAAPKIRVRGATSLSGENKPLWVVDGIILEDVVNISNEALSTGDANTLIGSSVAGLNPDDIESFTILKDAAATAMYGARAMNGVIVVTTKKGRNTDGKPLINYSGNFTTYLKPSYDQFDIMNSGEQMSVLLEQENKGYFNHSSMANNNSGGVFAKMYNQMYEYNPTTDSFMLKNTMNDRLNFLTRYANANTDWFDVLFKNSLLQEHSLSVSTGSDKAQTYFSTSYMNDSGQTIGDNVKRYTVNMRNNFKFSDKFSAELLANASIRDQRSPGTLTRESDPVYGKYSRNFDINPYSYSLNTSRLITPYDENGDLEYFTMNYAPFNIINEINNNYLNLEGLDIKVQGGIKYKFLKNLTYSADAAYRYAKTERQHYIKDGSNMAMAFRANANPTVNDGNILLYDDPDFPNEQAEVILPEGGFFNTSTNGIKNYYFRHNLEFDETFNVDHRLNLFGSMEVRYTDRQNSAYDGVGYQYNNGGLVNPYYKYFKNAIEAGDPYFGMNYGKDRFTAFAVRSAYSFKEKYLLNGTFRYDGSNLMGRSRTARWLPTWNISGAWFMDQEAFFEALNPVLTGAKIRATYGLVGSLGSANNSGAVFYSQIARRPYDDEKEAIIYTNNVQNSELTWEKLYEFNIGADLAFYDKIDVTVDIYKRDIFDLIGRIKTSGIGGEYEKDANYADMKSKGFELTIAGNPIKRDNFSWRTQFNFGVNKNEITKIDINDNIWNFVRAEGAAQLGRSQRGLYSIEFDGLNSEYGYPTYVGTEGQRNETNIYLQSTDVDYLKYHGPVDPTLTGGFFNQFIYKQFTVSALFTFATGNYVRLQPTIDATYNDMTSMSKDIVNRWMRPGDEAYTNIPAILDRYTIDNRVTSSTGAVVNAVYPYNAYNYSDQRVAKGDFIRLKNVSIAYRLPKSITDRLSISSAQLALVGNNLSLLYSDKKLNGADPEFFNNGGVAMPIPRQYTLSLKVGF